MLLTQTIKNSTDAIEKQRNARNDKRTAEALSRALDLLIEAGVELQKTLSYAAAMQNNGLTSEPVYSEEAHDSLLECINTCGQGVVDRELTIDQVKALGIQNQAAKRQLKTVWKSAAAVYTEGVRGYLQMIGSLTADPVQAKKLADRLAQAAEGEPSVTAVNELISDVEEANAITESFSINTEIEVFLRKVSNRQATVHDLTPEILGWLQEKRLTSRLMVRF